MHVAKDNTILGDVGIKSLTNSRGSRVAGPMSRSRVQSRGRGSNVAAEENDLEFEVTAEGKRLT